MSRRNFLAAGAGSLALTVLSDCCDSQAAPIREGKHHIPPDKGLDTTWVKGLYEKGSKKVYTGDELTCIGMPVGGICAGQLYLRGDGTLAEWGIFNVDRFTGYGDDCYRTYTPPSPVEQGFGLAITPAGGRTLYRTLDRRGFPRIEFTGEYPIGTVRYRTAEGDADPVEVVLEAFSPFVPLDARQSATPGTILRFRVKNVSPKRVRAALRSWIQNPVGQRHVGRYRAVRHNRITRSPGLTSLVMTIAEAPRPAEGELREPEIFANFEGGSYGKWQATGTAFGEKPAQGTLPGQQKVSGFGGQGLVNTFLHGDDSQGALTSPEFTIRRPYIQFRIGGGNRPDVACLNLLSGGKVVRTATGKDNEKLLWDFWDVGELVGKQATLQIVDRATGGWGHINVDDILFADAPPKGMHVPRLDQQPDFGSLLLGVLDEKARGAAAQFHQFRSAADTQHLDSAPATHEFPLGATSPDAGLVSEFDLEPGAEKEVTFLLCWHFVGGEHGRMYANWFPNVSSVARHLQENLDGLIQVTRLFRDTYFDSTLPHWLLTRLMMPISTLATNTVQWRRNGRFWAWEGVGCCDGTCTHVWNYAQGMARLFPELERSARVMQDLSVGFDAKTGRVGFRGENPSQPYAADGQCGTVLKCYREHLTSTDKTFLAEHWPKIKQVMEYELSRDKNDDGVIEDRQWNTYDLDFVGPNTFVGALYLAALMAAAKMADLMGDREFAQRCREIAKSGSRWTVKHLWNGEYFVQRIPPGDSPKFQYGDGCLADQLFGQTWADQVALGDLYPADRIQTALKSVYRYNWAPNVAAQSQAHPPQRWFARPGDAGLFTCTWPKGGRMAEPVLYRDEVWTGIEYQVASAFLHRGLIREGLSILRGIDDRYDGKRHNPWNEVECGDHYARALACWGCLIALSGFVYDGPAGRLGFAPRWQVENFRAFFTGAAGWGTLEQRRQSNSQTNRIVVNHGEVRLQEFFTELPATAQSPRVRVEWEGQSPSAQLRQARRRTEIVFTQPITVGAGQTLAVTFTW
ncbi:MAG TPA: GH116 family glycosyl hydrolase [Planctomycetaceae bacterium]|nr:GH116 family glycosyl hydrolase [Planctomycetaceae bacterium]